jgi:SAM-dependent methyltransferase
VLDITDLSRFPDGSFDVVVYYGGPLSYVWEKADVAARELVRVLRRPGGHLLVSVMSKLGTHRTWLNEMLALTETFGVEAVNQVFETGGLPAEFNYGHAMHLFTLSELRGLLEGAGCEIVAAPASNYLSAQSQAIEPMNDELWDTSSSNGSYARAVSRGQRHALRLKRRLQPTNPSMSMQTLDTTLSTSNADGEAHARNSQRR